MDISKEKYIETINELMKKCDDLALLDLIAKLLDESF